MTAPKRSRLRWLAGFALGCFAGPLVVYGALKGIQPVGVLEVTLVTDANEKVRVAEASFAGWPLTVEYAADGAVRFHAERTRRTRGELRLAVDTAGTRHTIRQAIDIAPSALEWQPDSFRLWEIFRFPKPTPICHVVVRARANGLSATDCLERFIM